MRPIMAHMLALFVLVAGVHAAERPSSSATKKQTKAHSNRSHTPTKRAAVDKGYQVGPASWYGKTFHGKLTASGEPYNMFQFTAAHQKLPLGTYVKVTNLRNGLWVVVRVNDRGPVPAGRIIDLSYGAAQMLALRARGVERVRLDVVRPDVVASNRRPSDSGDVVGLQ